MFDNFFFKSEKCSLLFTSHDYVSHPGYVSTSVLVGSSICFHDVSPDCPSLVCIGVVLSIS